MDATTEMKLVRIKSHLNIIEREIIDLSETWRRDPEATLQRLDDLIALVGSTKVIIDS